MLTHLCVLTLTVCPFKKLPFKVALKLGGGGIRTRIFAFSVLIFSPVSSNIV